MNRPARQSAAERLKELREWRQDNKQYQNAAMIARATGQYTCRPPTPFPARFRDDLGLGPDEAPLEQGLDRLEQTLAEEAARASVIHHRNARNTSPPTQETPVPTDAFRGAPPRSAEIFKPSDDYCVIRYRGDTYNLTPAAGQIVRVLHEAYKAGKVGIGSAEIKRHCKCGKVWDQFKRRNGRKFWDALIGKPEKDFFKLNLEPLVHHEPTPRR